MRRCSHSIHHSLSELNITPLLDLAFVLLVIFIITTTPVVNDLDLSLPKAARKEKEAPRKPNYVSVSAEGKVFLNRNQVTPEELLQQLIELRTVDPDLNVIVRGDSRTRYRKIAVVLDALQQANIAKVDLATEPLGKNL